jgi:predicted ArsR family transcriptional regulator
MGGAIKRTTAEAAEALGISVRAFMARATRAGLKAGETRRGGGRGRPSSIWTSEQLSTLRSKARKARKARKATR